MRAILLLILIFALPEIGVAEDDDWGGDDEAGFGEIEESSSEAAADPAEIKPWLFQGTLRQRTAFWTERFSEDDNPLAQARLSTDLGYTYKTSSFLTKVTAHQAYDFAYLYDRESYDEQTLNEYENINELREAFFQLSFDHFEVSFGRQIKTWGMGDMSSFLDLINPKDFREPGLSDLKDIRLPVLMTMLGYYPGSFRAEFIAVHEAYFGKLSPPFGPFGTLKDFFESDETGDEGYDPNFFFRNRTFEYVHKQDRFDLKNTEFFGRVVYNGAGFDLGIMAASQLDNAGVLVGLPSPLELGMNQAKYKTVYMTLDHRRYNLAGLSSSFAYDSWLLKSEFLFEKDKSVNILNPELYNTNTLTNDGVDAAQVGNLFFPEPLILDKNIDVFSALFSLQYSGSDLPDLFLEYAKRWVSDKDKLLVKIYRPQFGLRIRDDFMKERLEFMFLGTIIGLKGEQGWLARAEINYEIIDSVKAGLGYVVYHSGTERGAFAGFDKHDRLWINFQWDFQY